MSTPVPLLFSGRGTGIHIDLDELIKTRMLVQANSGGGKSFVLRALFEQTFGRVQHLIFDTEGEFATLRGPERPYVVAAVRGGDVEASPHTAALLVRRLMELRSSAVFDLYDLPKAGKLLFVHNALTELMSLPHELWNPVLIGLDEIHEFAPQDGECLARGAVEDLASRGRKRRYCLVGATQRIGKLSKDVAAELLNKFIGRASLDVDVKRAAFELGMNPKEAVAALRDLRAGQFHAYGPALSKQGLHLVVGPMPETRPPKEGRAAAGPPPAPDKVRSVLAELADLPKEAEERVKTLEALRAEVKELKRQLREAPKAKVETKEVPVLKEAQLKRLEKLAEKLDQAVAKVAIASAELSGPLKSLTTAAPTPAKDPVPLLRVQVQAHAERPADQTPERQLRNPLSEVMRRRNLVPAVVRKVLEGPGPFAGLAKGERAVLSAIAQHQEAGADRAQLTVLTGYKTSSRNTYLQRLSAGGLAAESGDRWFATQAGLDALGPSFVPLPTGSALRAHWLGRLPTGEATVLSCLTDAYPRWLPREAVGEATGYKSSSRNSYLQRLSARKLVDAAGTQVRASELLFDGGAE